MVPGVAVAPTVTGTLKLADVPPGQVPMLHVMSYCVVLHEKGGPES
jgi:hypothetical protein